MYKNRGGKEEWACYQTSMKHLEFPKNFVETLLVADLDPIIDELQKEAKSSGD